MPDEQARAPLPEPPRQDPVPAAPPAGGPSPAGQEARDQLSRINAAISRLDRQRAEQLSSESVLNALKQTGGQ